VVFNAIQKRIFKSFKKELEQIYKIHYYFLDDIDYQMVINDPNGLVENDFRLEDMDITPVGNPGNSSTAQRLAKAQAIGQLPSVPQHLKDIEFLKALEFSEQDIAQLVPPPNPNPEPTPQDLLVAAEIKKTEAEANKIQSQPQLEMADLVRKSQQDQQLQAESQSRMVKMEIDGAVKILETQMQQQKVQMDSQMNQIRAVTEQIRQVNEMMRNQMDLANDATQSIETIEVENV
jgi:DNA-binding transcriptional MerR regulator